MKKQHKLVSLFTALVMLGMLAVSVLPAGSVSAAPLPPEIIAPVGIITDNTPTFKWTPVVADGVTGYKYIVYRNGSTSPLFTKTPSYMVCAGDVCSHTPDYSKNLKVGIYYWKVIAMKGDKIFGSWSDSVKFTISAPPIGFSSNFSGTRDGWGMKYGLAAWGTTASTLYTNGSLYDWSSAYFTRSEAYSNFDFVARIKRVGSAVDPNCLDIRMGNSKVDSNFRWHTGYAFCVNNSGKFQVVKRNADKTFTNLVPWTPIPAESEFVANDFNTLRVVAVGSDMLFYINGTRAAYVDDPDFSIGWIGFEEYKSGSTGTGKQFQVDWVKVAVLFDRTLMNQLLSQH